MRPCRPTFARFTHVWLLLAAVASTVSAAPLEERIRYRLEAQSEGLSVQGEPLRAEPALREFYARRRFAAAWLAGDDLSDQGKALLGVIRGSADDGLDPRQYHLEAIVAAQGAEAASPAGRLVDLDVLLTDAYLLLASHLLAGQVDPVTVDREWHVKRREADLLEQLENALAAGRVAESLSALRPGQPGYERLREVLARHRGIVAHGGWRQVPPGPALKPGQQSPRVAAVRERLAASGDLAAAEVGSQLYDAELQAAVARYQQRHGLEVDGVVGRETLASLNVPAAERVRQIELNLERWRWLPQDLGERHIRVNIADYSLQLWEHGQAVATQRVVVGRDYRRTPVFTGRMTYLVLNPFWEVPPRIAADDLLLQARKDPAFFQRMNMQVLRGWGAAEQAVDPASVDWAAVPSRGFPYRFRQAPGPLNALGQVKFMFPNAFNVYLHDSPARELFARHRRAYSSGCIRVQDPVALAEWVLAGTKGWDRAAVERAIASGETRTVSLARALPVHIQYWTAWVDPDGTVQFREDLYGRDRRLSEALGVSEASGA